MALVAGIARKLYRGLGIFELGFIFSTLILVFIFVFAAVITRYWLRISLPWLDELAVFALIATVFIGAAAATRQKAHIKLDLLSTLLRQEKARGIIAWSLELFCLFMAGYFAYITYQYMMSAWGTPGFSAALPIMHVGWLKSTPFVGSVLWSIELIIILVRDGINLIQTH